jgi:hypothetical protein
MIEGLETLASDARDAVPLIDLLSQAGAQIGGLGPEFASERGQLQALRQRLREERCHLAVLGQFKRGKSTLVNALLGEPILPAAVVPITSIPTFLHGGEQPAARVQFENGKADERLTGASAGALAEFLARFVTESANPHNRLSVRMVEATCPANASRRARRAHPSLREKPDRDRIRRTKFNVPDDSPESASVCSTEVAVTLSNQRRSGGRMSLRCW